MIFKEILRNGKKYCNHFASLSSSFLFSFSIFFCSSWKYSLRMVHRYVQWDIINAITFSFCRFFSASSRFWWCLILKLNIAGPVLEGNWNQLSFVLLSCGQYPHRNSYLTLVIIIYVNRNWFKVIKSAIYFHRIHS